MRHIEEVFNKFAPFNTHQVLITTGDFSDPPKVQVKNGDIKVTLEPDVKGDVSILHLVPKGLFGLENLRGLQVGDKIKIIGYEEADGIVNASNGD